MSSTTKAGKSFAIAWVFLLPNFIGFLIFTSGPVFFSLYMAFTDWSLVKHNDLTGLKPAFVGFENFRRLLVGDESRLFWESFYNTAYLMLGIPIGIAGSLLIALALNRPVGPAKVKSKFLLSTLALTACILAAGGSYLVTYPGEKPTITDVQQAIAAFEQQHTGDVAPSPDQIYQAYEIDLRVSRAVTAGFFILGLVVAFGISTGLVFFRTLFYLPSLLSGIALFLLWKSLYKPTGGAVNEALRPVCNILQNTVSTTPAYLWYTLGILLWLIFSVICIWMLSGLLRNLSVGDSGFAGAICSLLAVAAIGLIGLGCGYWLCQLPAESLFATGYVNLNAEQLETIRQNLISNVFVQDLSKLDFVFITVGQSVQPEVLIDSLRQLTNDMNQLSRMQDIIFSLSSSVHDGFTAGNGLQPPNWLVDDNWAKPALLIMGVWTAVGGGNMLLYLAGLSNIPEDLYEAAAIDGAGTWNRFWNITWPQLAPTTFFIVIMSTIGGLQGGFDQARAMTEGKYGTEVLTYYLYKLAFTDEFQLGLASAVAWLMFACIFIMTVINYRFGSRMVND